MNTNNCSHILNIKVISMSSNTVVKDDHLLEMIKGIFLQKDQYFNGVKMIWRKIDWIGLYKYFDMGDIVIDSIFSIDEILVESVRIVLTEIEFELHEKGLLFNGQKIIFNIIKPLSERIPLVDTIGIIV